LTNEPKVPDTVQADENPSVNQAFIQSMRSMSENQKRFVDAAIRRSRRLEAVTWLMLAIVVIMGAAVFWMALRR